MKTVLVNIAISVNDDVEANDVCKTVEESLIHTEEYDDQAMQTWNGWEVNIGKSDD